MAKGAGLLGQLGTPPKKKRKEKVNLVAPGKDWGRPINAR